MIRVLSILHGNTYGGPHNRNAQVAPMLEELHGIKTIMLVPEEPGNAAERLRGQGLRVVEFQIPRLRARISPSVHWHFIVGFRKTLRALERLLVEEKIDLVQINGISNPHGAIAARKLGIPIVWQILDTFPPPFFLRLMMPYVRRSAGAVMCTGRRVAAAHPGIPLLGDRLVFFHPPVNTERFHHDDKVRDAVRNEFGIDARAPVVGTISNLNPQKGLRTFIRAAARLRNREPSVKFVILGRRYNTHQQYYDSLLEEAARLGLRFEHDLFVRDPGLRVPELAQAFDVFWMTPEPRSEGIPTVIEEAMALGLPVVATDVGSIREIVFDCQTGFLVPIGDESAIAQRTLQILENPELRRAMSDGARAYAEAHFPVRLCAEKHLRAFRIALKRSCEIHDCHGVRRRSL
jgi:glycosyltransferase involved in cell wall biosynthesis